MDWLGDILLALFAAVIFSHFISYVLESREVPYNSVLVFLAIFVIVLGASLFIRPMGSV